MPQRACRILAMLIALTPSVATHADALVVNRSMQASTIAEIFVDADAIRVELAIGLNDLDAFRNVMPDELYERLGHEPSPIAERLSRFLAEDWVLRVDDEPLAGEIGAITPRTRLRRDEITGEPLPSIEGDDAADELIVFAEITYPLATLPATLSLSPPTAAASTGRAVSIANIGFVVYHRDLPVNDFRYLSATETIDLDWTDAWYSRFRNPNIRRQYDAPISVFLYVDPLEVRKEIIVRPMDLQPWVDLGLEGLESIPIAMQADVTRRVAEFLTPLNPVTIDGVAATPELDRIHFIRRTLRQTGVVDPPEELSLTSATLGVIFVYPVRDLPQQVEMTWELFGNRIETVPAVATDEAGGLPTFVTVDDPVLVWTNYLTNPTKRVLAEVASPPAARRFVLPGLGLLCVAGVLATLRTRSTMRLVAIVLLLAGAVVTLTITRAPRLEAAEAEAIVQGLLQNVYRAFDFREENVIYDTLERSVAGDLLSQTYLETRRALELRNQGGARAKVESVEIVDSMTSPTDEAGFTMRCTWNVTGSVGHWGHIHQRRNQYEADLTVAPIDGVWKVTGLELLSEQRL